MKTIARLEDGTGYLMEVSNAEHHALKLLEHVVQGGVIHWPWNLGDKVDQNLADVFTAIRAFTLSKGMTNAVREHAEQIDRYFEEANDDGEDVSALQE